nr:MAG TPA: HEAT-STABLE ENTEROTOXIN B-STABLE, ENTEROTOXIN, DISULFIDE [Caudoviricetes sp.]
MPIFVPIFTLKMLCDDYRQAIITQSGADTQRLIID